MLGSCSDGGVVLGAGGFVPDLLNVGCRFRVLVLDTDSLPCVRLFLGGHI